MNLTNNPNHHFSDVDHRIPNRKKLLCHLGSNNGGIEQRGGISLILVRLFQCLVCLGSKVFSASFRLGKCLCFPFSNSLLSLSSCFGGCRGSSSGVGACWKRERERERKREIRRRRRSGVRRESR